MEPIPRRAAREPEAFFDSKLRSEWTVLDPNKKHARSTAGTQYWCALVALPAKHRPGMRRAVNVVFDAASLPDGAAVGVLPPGDKKSDRFDREDHLGRQLAGIGVWSDGVVFQNGERFASLPKMNLAEDVLYLELSGGTFTVYRGGVVHARFQNVPDDWRFAVGGFGGGARAVREGAEVRTTSPSPRLVVSDLSASSLPDADLSQGGSGSDAFVQIELLVDESSSPPPPELPCVQSSTRPNCSSEVSWADVMSLHLPDGFSAGRLLLTVWDEDQRTGHDVLGVATVPVAALAGAGSHVTVDKLHVKGGEAPGAAGYYFPDFELSFAYNFVLS